MAIVTRKCYYSNTPESILFYFYSRLNWKQYMTAILIFTVASPLGMGIGIALSDMEQTLAGDIANR